MGYEAVFQGGGGGWVGRLGTGGCLAAAGIGVAADLEPVIDEVAESVVWDHGWVLELLHCDRAGLVARGKPFFYAGPVVGLACAQSDWICEQI
ncbi:hypothetical protein U1Q18_011124 [Sarracenia purpurea var. burkii]